MKKLLAILILNLTVLVNLYAITDTSSDKLNYKQVITRNLDSVKSLSEIMPFDGGPNDRYFTGFPTNWDFKVDLEAEEIFAGSGVLENIISSDDTLESLDLKISDLVYDKFDFLELFNIELQLDKKSSIIKDPKTGLSFLRYTQIYKGIEVLESEANFRFKFSNLVDFDTLVFKNINLDTKTKISKEAALRISSASMNCEKEVCEVSSSNKLFIYPIKTGQAYEYKLVWENKIGKANPYSLWTSYVDAHTGDVIENYNTVFYVTGSIMGTAHPRKYSEDKIEIPMKGLHINFAGKTSIVDEDGYFELPQKTGKMTFALKGEGADVKLCKTAILDILGALTDVVDQSRCKTEQKSFYKDITNPNEDISIYLDERTLNDSELDAYFHVNEVIDFASQFIDLDWFNRSLPVKVNIEELQIKFAFLPLVKQKAACNAFWDGSSLSFFEEGILEKEDLKVKCANTGTIADIIYHEWGHGFDQNSHGGKIHDPIKSEAIADIIAFHITDDFEMAPGFFLEGSPTGLDYIREVETNRHYPEDLQQEPHYDSLIFSSMWWDLRQSLINKYGYKDGNFHSAKLLFQHVPYSTKYTNSLSAVLVADDDDGNLANGTPNEGLIRAAFYDHGLDS
ncbi:MAG: hypothetical protein ABIA04_02115 [Pseudomonadota bacterium]